MNFLNKLGGLNKAWVGGISAGFANDLAERIMVIVAWLTGMAIPDDVHNSIVWVLAGIITIVAVYVVPNKAVVSGEEKE